MELVWEVSLLEESSNFSFLPFLQWWCWNLCQKSVSSFHCYLVLFLSYLQMFSIYYILRYPFRIHVNICKIWERLPNDEKETCKGDCTVVDARFLWNLGLAKNRAPLCAKIMRPEGIVFIYNKIYIFQKHSKIYVSMHDIGLYLSWKGCNHKF